MGYALGIDLGTTFTAAAVCRDGRAQAVQLEAASFAAPSVVWLGAEGTELIGRAAEQRGGREPERLGREFKRRIGDPVPIVLGGTPWSAEALSAKVLRWVVDAVARREGGPADTITLSHPASWGPYKLDLLREATRSAGLDAVGLVSEPVAAATCHAATQRVPVGRVVAVYDLGGGTFDAAVVRRTEDGFVTLGRGEGIERLGGIDFDEAVLEHVRAGLGSAEPGDSTVEGSSVEGDTAGGSRVEASRAEQEAAALRLRADATLAKETLSADTEAVISVPGSGGTPPRSVRLVRSEFEDMIRPNIVATVEALRRALRSAGIERPDLVLLVGGSSRIPLVAQVVSAELGVPIAVDTDPKLAVALGAALTGATSTGAMSTGATSTGAMSTGATSILRTPPVTRSAGSRPAAAGEPIEGAVAGGAAAAAAGTGSGTAASGAPAWLSAPGGRVGNGRPPARPDLHSDPGPAGGSLGTGPNAADGSAPAVPAGPRPAPPRPAQQQPAAQSWPPPQSWPAPPPRFEPARPEQPVRPVPDRTRMLPPAAGPVAGFDDGSAGFPPESGWSRRWIPAVIASVLAVLVLTVLAVLALAPGLPGQLGLGSSAQSPTVQPTPGPSPPATPTPTPVVTPTATPPPTPTPAPTADPEAVRLRDECAAGSGRSCDGLYVAAAAGSAYEAFADSCGGRYTEAEKVNSPDCNDRTLTDPADITAWSNGCHDGVPEDCDLLFDLAPFDSLEFTYGRTCGGLRRVPQGPTEGGTCVEPAG